MLPELLSQTPADAEIGPVTANGRMTRANIMMPSPIGAPMQSFRPAGVPIKPKHLP